MTSSIIKESFKVCVYEIRNDLVPTLNEDESSLCESSEIVGRILRFDHDPSFCSPLKSDYGADTSFQFSDTSLSQ